MKRYLIFLLVGALVLVGGYFLYSDYSVKKKVEANCKSYLEEVETLREQFNHLKERKDITLLDIAKKAKEDQAKIEKIREHIQDERLPKIFKTQIQDEALKKVDDIKEEYHPYLNVYSQIKEVYKKSVDIDKEIEEMRGIYATEEIVSMESLLKELEEEEKKTEEDRKFIKILKFKIERANKKKKMSYSMIDQKFSELNLKNNKLIESVQSLEIPEDIERFSSSLIEYFKERKEYLSSIKEVYKISKDISDKYDEALDTMKQFFTHLENSSRYADLWMFNKAFEELDKAGELKDKFKSLMEKIDELEAVRNKIRTDAEKHYLAYKREENKTFNVNIIIVLKKNVKEVKVNGSTVSLDAPPLEVDDRTFVPIKFITEILGGKISWDAEESKATIEIEDKTIEMWFDLDKKTAKVNGEPYLMDVAPFTKFDRGYVPIRFVAEVLGCDVIWDSEKEEVIIISRNLDWKIFDI